MAVSRPEKRRQERADKKVEEQALPPFRIRAIKVQAVLEFTKDGKMADAKLAPEMTIFEADPQFAAVLEFVKSKGFKPVEP